MCWSRMWLSLALCRQLPTYHTYGTSSRHSQLNQMWFCIPQQQFGALNPTTPPDISPRRVPQHHNVSLIAANDCRPLSVLGKLEAGATPLPPTPTERFPATPAVAKYGTTNCVVEEAAPPGTPKCGLRREKMHVTETRGRRYELALQSQVEIGFEFIQDARIRRPVACVGV
ncbi:hypothetical protein M011DRAFT_515200 [Sporormia fimetaria CBS 119925]|uniref:Uncharacterized protein n=1 Tax=Sporormia fimetaria CBS 119925 TaxID=1340428 RepID=A0A6A6VHZ9_9PLEO|nr:hypothetical protein M011DRAFT_515200 [Sporormia fimetaria CBS 119925]